jgi:hypothetical protein
VPVVAAPALRRLRSFPDGGGTVTEQPSLRARAAAAGLEIHELRRQAALANDVQALVPLKVADRVLKREFGRGQDQPGDSYSVFEERLIEQLYQADLAEERVIQKRIDSLTENVRAEVQAELEADRAELDATAAALHDREQAVAERERQARPSYRARFGAVGAFLAFSADLLIRTVS